MGSLHVLALVLLASCASAYRSHPIAALQAKTQRRLDRIEIPACDDKVCIHYYWAGDPSGSDAYKAAAFDGPNLMIKAIDPTKHQLVFWHHASVDSSVYIPHLANGIIVKGITDPVEELIPSDDPLYSDINFAQKGLHTAKKYVDRFLGYRKFALVKDLMSLFILTGYGGYFIDTTAAPQLKYECYAGSGDLTDDDCQSACKLADPFKAQVLWPNSKVVNWEETLAANPCVDKPDRGDDVDVDCATQCPMREVPFTPKLVMPKPTALKLQKMTGTRNWCLNDRSIAGSLRYSKDPLKDCPTDHPSTNTKAVDYMWLASNKQNWKLQVMIKSFVERLRAFKGDVKVCVDPWKLQGYTTGKKEGDCKQEATLEQMFSGSYKTDEKFTSNQRATIANVVEQMLPSITSAAYADGLASTAGGTAGVELLANVVGAGLGGPNFRGWNFAQYLTFQVNGQARQVGKRMTGGWRGASVNLLEQALL